MEFIFKDKDIKWGIDETYSCFAVQNKNKRYDIHDEITFKSVSQRISSLLNSKVKLSFSNICVPLTFYIETTDEMYNLLYKYKNEIETELERFDSKLLYNMNNHCQEIETEYAIRYGIGYTKTLTPIILNGNAEYKHLIVMDSKINPKHKTMLIIKYGLTPYEGNDLLVRVQY